MVFKMYHLCIIELAGCMAKPRLPAVNYETNQAVAFDSLSSLRTE